MRKIKNRKLIISLLIPFLLFSCVFFSLPLVLINCTNKKKVSVPWRTENCEGSVGTQINSTREYIWITDPDVLGGTWGVSKQDSDPLPPGINLDKTEGKLAGTPTKVGTYNVRFTYTVVGYEKNVSTPIVFHIFPSGTTHVDVTWVNDMVFTRNVSVTAAKIYTSSNQGGCIWLLREGFSLPDGLTLNSSSGEISGTPQVSSQFAVSFMCCKDGYVYNLSDKFFITVNLTHTVVITGTSNGGWTTDNLTVVIVQLDPSVYTFAMLIYWLSLQNQHKAQASGNASKTGSPNVIITQVEYKNVGMVVHDIYTPINGIDDYWTDTNCALTDTIT